MSVRWLRAIVAIIWTGVLVGSYLWMIAADPNPIDIHGPVEVAFGVLVVLTAPSGWLGVYGVYSAQNAIGWPHGSVAILATVWVAAGLLGFLQWFVLVPIFWTILTEHFLRRGNHISLSSHQS